MRPWGLRRSKQFLDGIRDTISRNDVWREDGRSVSSVAAVLRSAVSQKYSVGTRRRVSRGTAHGKFHGNR